MAENGDHRLVPFLVARRLQRRRYRRQRHRPAASPEPRQCVRQARAVSPSQRRGAELERRALALLKQHGLTLIARNVQYDSGEIDLVMRDGAVLVFVEVRYRQTAQFGGAVESIDAAKRQRLIRTARHFLLTSWPHPTPQCRFDVVAFDGNTCKWLRDVVIAP